MVARVGGVVLRYPRVFPVLIVAVFLSAAHDRAWADSGKASNFSSPPSGSRIVIVPPFIKISELTAGGLIETKADWTATARTNVEASLAQEFQDRGWVRVTYKAPSDPERLRVHAQVGKVYILIAQTIQTHHLNPARQLPTKRGRFDWTLGSDIVTVREDHDNADYLLFTEFQDTFSSGGRQALNVVAALVGGVIRWGRQIMIAGLVDLRTGDVVWFNRVIDNTNDLRGADSARAAIRNLFADLPQ